MGKSNSTPQTWGIENWLWMCPQEIRIATRMATAVGMDVFQETVDGNDCVCWLGSEEEFSQLGMFKSSLDFSSIKRKKWVYPWSLRGYIYRQPCGRLKFAIENLNTHGYDRGIAIMRRVRNDDAYQSFKLRYMTPVEVTE